MGRLEKNVINEITCLGLDLVHKLGHGNYNNVVSGNKLFYSLYGEELQFKRNASNWINRDRVVYASASPELLYSTLYMSGFDISLDDFTGYGELNSKLPRHPKKDTEIGLDANFGNDDSFGVAVGIALGERFFETIISRLKPKSKLINFNTYLVCKLNDLMSGRSYEALSLAGVQKLEKLIVLCEVDEKTEDAKLQSVMNEDLENKYEALGFAVLYSKNTVDNICETIDQAKKSKKPTIIFINTFSNDNNNNKALEDYYTKLKNEMGHSLESFFVDENTKDLYLKIIDDRVNKYYRKWLIEYEACRNLNNARLNEILDLLEENVFAISFDESIFKIKEDYFEELAISNEKIINVIASKNPVFLGASLNNAKDNKTMLVKSDFNTFDYPLGQNLNLGQRNMIIGDVLNGLSMMNIKCFGSIAAKDLFKSIDSIRNSSLMNLPVTYIISDDSASECNQGIHSPVEQLNDLRMIPNLLVIRPTDINEVIGAWDFILKNNWPVALCLNNKAMQRYRNTNSKYVKYGAYMIRKERMHLDGIIISSGSDIKMAMDVADELFKDGIDLRVVSMPCMELFLHQNPRYEEQLLPKEIKTFVIESSSTLTWNRFASNPNCIFGIDVAVGDGKEKDAVKELGLDKESIKRKIKENI